MKNLALAAALWAVLALPAQSETQTDRQNQAVGEVAIAMTAAKYCARLATSNSGNARQKFLDAGFTAEELDDEMFVLRLMLAVTRIESKFRVQEQPHFCENIEALYGPGGAGLLKIEPHAPETEPAAPWYHSGDQP